MSHAFVGREISSGQRSAINCVAHSMENGGDGAQAFKRLRTDDDENPVEALSRLHAALQSAISSVAANIGQTLSEEVDHAVIAPSAAPTAILEQNGEAKTMLEIAPNSAGLQTIGATDSFSAAPHISLNMLQGNVGAGPLSITSGVPLPNFGVVPSPVTGRPPLPSMLGSLPVMSGLPLSSMGGCMPVMSGAPLPSLGDPLPVAGGATLPNTRGPLSQFSFTTPSGLSLNSDPSAASAKQEEQDDEEEDLQAMEEALAKMPPGNAALMRKQMMARVKEKEQAKQEGRLPVPQSSPPAQAPQSSPSTEAAGASTVISSQFTLPANFMEENPLAAQLCMLAQQSQEAAQTASSAAAACVQARLQQADPKQVDMLVQTADQSVQRTSWASSWLSSYVTSSLETGEHGHWFIGMKQIIQQSSEVAQSAAKTCRGVFTGTPAQASAAAEAGSAVSAEKSWVSPIPCKWFFQGQCRNGEWCKYSHVIEPRPLERKTPVECNYFQKGQCTRGAGCPFAHGEEEMMEIKKVVEKMRTTKRILGLQKGRRNPLSLV